MIFTRLKERTYGDEFFSVPKTVTFATKGEGKLGGDAFLAFCSDAVVADAGVATIVFDVDPILPDKAEIYKILIEKQKIKGAL